jgi:rod shape determining protein RodA
VGLVMLQPDFGSAMVLIGMWLLMSLFARLPKGALVTLILVATVGGALIWSFGLQDYQRARILTFLHPEADLRGAGYNAAQAQIAIGSGGWFGKGVGEGSQARLRFLPAAATDFIFSVLGEGLGFAGLVVIFSLFLLIISRYLKLASEAEDDFAGLLLVGLAAILFIHCLVNMGMNLGIMPITGIPLPFLSAAASSLVVTCLAIGIAESVAVRRPGNG